MLRQLLCLVCLPLLASQPNPAGQGEAYVYSGKPIALNHACGVREIEDLGLVCTEEEPCPLYVELSGVEQAGNKLFLAGNFHTGAATLASLLLASEDEGKTWREVHPRLPNALLDQIQFVDFQTGFVSGNVAGSLARDPFFLKTENGGKTWRRINIFDDGGYGVIGSFHFSSPAQGTLTIEGPRGRSRYRRMETMTGGESWMTREISDTAPAAKPVKPAGALRLRGDTASRSIRLEKRDGAKWVTLAEFALSSGQCQPEKRPEPAEEPPVPEPPQP